MATLVRSLTLATVLTGCTFESPYPEVIPPGPMPTAQPCRANEQGVVLCVDFEDQSLAARAVDHSPNQNHAIAHDVDSIERLPPAERAALLSGVSSLRVPESPTLDLSAFTLEMWIKPAVKPSKRKDVGLFDNHGHYTMRLRDDLKIRCGIGLGAAPEARVSSESAIPLQQWSHVACRYAAGEMRVYVNGHLSDCRPVAGLVPGGLLGSAIGAEIDPLVLTDGLTDRFLGGVDNVRVYDHALDDARLCQAAGQPTGSCTQECPATSGAGD